MELIGGNLERVGGFSLAGGGRDLIGQAVAGQAGPAFPPWPREAPSSLQA